MRIQDGCGWMENGIILTERRPTCTGIWLWNLLQERSTSSIPRESAQTENNRLDITNIKSAMGTRVPGTFFVKWKIAIDWQLFRIYRLLAIGYRSESVWKGEGQIHRLQYRSQVHNAFQLLYSTRYLKEGWGKTSHRKGLPGNSDILWFCFRILCLNFALKVSGKQQWKRCRPAWSG